MTGFVIEQELRDGVPMVALDIVTETKPPNGEEPRMFRVTGIIDTGSPACIVNTGVLPDYFFRDGLSSKPLWAFSGVFDGCRGATMGLWFMDHCNSAFAVPVFEKALGLYEPREPFMLLGRSFLNFGTFTYDGPSQKWKWVYDPK